MQDNINIRLTKVLSGEKYKLKKFGNYYAVSSKAINFKIHKKLFKKLVKIKKPELILALLDAHKNLVSV